MQNICTMSEILTGSTSVLTATTDQTIAIITVATNTNTASLISLFIVFLVFASSVTTAAVVCQNTFHQVFSFNVSADATNEVADGFAKRID